MIGELGVYLSYFFLFFFGCFFYCYFIRWFNFWFYSFASSALVIYNYGGNEFGYRYLRVNLPT